MLGNIVHLNIVQRVVIAPPIVAPLTSQLVLLLRLPPKLLLSLLTQLVQLFTANSWRFQWDLVGLEAACSGQSFCGLPCRRGSSSDPTQPTEPERVHVE